MVGWAIGSGIWRGEGKCCFGVEQILYHEKVFKEEEYKINMGWRDSSATKKGFYIGLIISAVIISFYILQRIISFVPEYGANNSIVYFIFRLLFIGAITIGIFSFIGNMFAWKAKTYHILHTIILIGIFLELLSNISIFWILFQGSWHLIVPILGIPLIFSELIFIIISFKKCDLKNINFKKSGVLSLMGVLSFFIVSFLAASLFLQDSSGFFLAAAPIIALVIGSIFGLLSFLIFEIISFVYLLKGFNNSKN